MKKELIKIIISILLFVLSYFTYNLYIKNILLIISYLVVGLEIIINAFKNIIKGDFLDENFLMTIATIGAIIINEIPEAVAVMLFYSIGELCCDYGIDKSKKDILSLMELKSDTVNKYKNGNLEVVDAREIKIGDIILVKKGERVPLDGIVLEGISYLDTSSLTGEIVPVKVIKDDKILSGTLNTDNALKVKVTSIYEESTISKILKLVEESQNLKSKEEKFITKFAKIYTPIIIILAILFTIIPVLVFKKSFDIYFYKSLSFLVISCPCALVISIPLTFFSTIGASSKMGVLLKGTNYIETLSKIDMVVCDKTGTLTYGVFEVQKINNINITKEQLIKYASYAECYSNHLVALSIKKYYGKKIDESKIQSIKEIEGLGIIANVLDKEVIIGNERLMKKYKINYVKENTSLYIAIDREYKGSILIDDKVKKDSLSFIENLKKNNIHVVMLTGDNEEKASKVANSLKIDNYYSELLPMDKVNIVKRLKENNTLIFIGDGINDAPVLKASDIGISMGSIGSDAAVLASDVVILNDELSKVNTLLKLSKKTMKIAKENIIISIFIKVIILVLSILGICSMWEAVFADVGVTVVAVLNSFRVLNIKNIK